MVSFTTTHTYFLTDPVSTEMIYAGASVHLVGWPNTLRRLSYKYNMWKTVLFSD